MRLQIKSFLVSRFAVLIAILILPLVLTGCISHWFLESSSRLQIENGTEDYSIVRVDILANDGTSKKWIDEVILPGERSRVVEEDLVGEFTLRFKFTKSKDGSGKVYADDRSFDLDGGSLYMVVEADGDSLTYRFR